MTLKVTSAISDIYKSHLGRHIIALNRRACVVKRCCLNVFCIMVFQSHLLYCRKSNFNPFINFLCVSHGRLLCLTVLLSFFCVFYQFTYVRIDCFSCFTFTLLYLYYCTVCICVAALLVRIKIHNYYILAAFSLLVTVKYLCF